MHSSTSSILEWHVNKEDCYHGLCPLWLTALASNWPHPAKSRVLLYPHTLVYEKRLRVLCVLLVIEACVNDVCDGMALDGVNSSSDCLE